MSSLLQLQKTMDLIRLERQADLEYYRNKVLLRSLHQRTLEGTTWYPVRLKRDYIGTGERIVIEVERTTHLDQPHAFQSGKSVSIFSNASRKPEKEHANGVINYVRDNTMVVTLNNDELPDWIEDGLLGVDVMFDEMSYREMEHALKELMKADGNRIAELREILLGDGPVSSIQNSVPNTLNSELRIQNPPSSILNDSQNSSLRKVINTEDIAFIHGPPGTGKTTTLAQAIQFTVKEEQQVLVSAPSNAAVDLLVEKLSVVPNTPSGMTPPDRASSGVQPTNPKVVLPVRRNSGGVLTSQTKTPANRKSRTFSDSVRTVTTAAARYIIHRRGSVPMVFRVSLVALEAMMPITQAPTP